MRRPDARTTVNSVPVLYVYPVPYTCNMLSPRYPDGNPLKVTQTNKSKRIRLHRNIAPRRRVLLVVLRK